MQRWKMLPTLPLLGFFNTCFCPHFVCKFVSLKIVSAILSVFFHLWVNRRETWFLSGALTRVKHWRQDLVGVSRCVGRTECWHEYKILRKQCINIISTPIDKGWLYPHIVVYMRIIFYPHIVYKRIIFYPHIVYMWIIFYLHIVCSSLVILELKFKILFLK